MDGESESISSNAKSASGVCRPVPIALMNDSLRVQIRKNALHRAAAQRCVFRYRTSGSEK